jgi:hypothetical protein
LSILREEPLDGLGPDHGSFFFSLHTCTLKRGTIYVTRATFAKQTYCQGATDQVAYLRDSDTTTTISHHYKQNHLHAFLEFLYP